jgi:hypothetical protein
VEEDGILSYSEQPADFGPLIEAWKAARWATPHDERDRRHEPAGWFNVEVDPKGVEQWRRDGCRSGLLYYTVRMVGLTQTGFLDFIRRLKLRGSK